MVKKSMSGFEKWQTCRYGVERMEGGLGIFTTGACCTNRQAASLFRMIKWSSFVQRATPLGRVDFSSKSPFSSEAYVLAPGYNFRECSQCDFYVKERSLRSPQGCKKKKAKSYKEKGSFDVVSFDRHNARQLAKDKLPNHAVITAIKVLQSPRKGFFRIGKRSGKYRIYWGILSNLAEK